MDIAQQKKVGIWLRVSTKMQVDDSDSLEHHEARAVAYCKAMGWDITKTYRLEGISGKDIFDNPITKQMIVDVQSVAIDTLVFSSLSRLARNTRQLLKISDVFQEHDAGLVSLKESIDTASPAGRLFFTMLSALATFEAEEISERVKASVVTRAKLSKQTGGAASYGYAWVDGILETIPEEAVVLKEMFTIFLDCKRIKTTARKLNEKGYRTRRGKPFTDATVKRLLMNPVAKGLRKANYTHQDKDGQVTLKPESEWIYVTSPTVVSEEIYDAVNAELSQTINTRKPKTRLPVHPFSGLVFCCCDENTKMRVMSSVPNKYTCPKCRAKIPKDDLEEVYKQQLQQFMLSPEKMSDYLAQANDAIGDKQKQLMLLKDEFDKLQRETKKLYDLYISDGITAETFGEMNKSNEERTLQLKQSIPELEAEIDIAQQQTLNEAQSNYDGTDLFNKWNSFSHEEKISVIRSLTEKIRVCEDEIYIQMHFIPSVIANADKQRSQGNESGKIRCLVAIPLEFRVSRIFSDTYKKHQNIGELIKNTRKARNISQKKLRTHFGVNKSTIYKWENDTMAVIADRYFPSIVEFLNFCPSKHFKQKDRNYSYIENMQVTLF